MFYSCHTGCSRTTKKRAPGRGARTAANTGALNAAPRQSAARMGLASHKCFPFSRARPRYPPVPTGEGFWGRRTPKWEQSPERSRQPQPWQTPCSPTPALLENVLFRAIYLRQFHIFEQIFQCGSTLGFRYLLKRSKRKWSSSIS